MKIDGPVVALVVFAFVVAVANGAFVGLAASFGADDMRVGKGHSKFPPQVLTQPR